MGGIGKDEILFHDLFHNCILFDFSSTVSLIVAEIQKGLLSKTAVTELKQDSTLSTPEIIYFMYYVRQCKGFCTNKTFSCAINGVFDLIQRVTNMRLYIYSLKFQSKDANREGKKKKRKEQNCLQ